jgi:carbonic anhydrase
MKKYKEVFENNRRWVAEMKAADPDYFTEMAKDQSPDFLYIGCSDSRVPANVIMGLPPGDIFVHRNIANLVVNTDDNCQCVIQYAVDVLKVKHIVVCGHYGCGGIKAAMVPKDLGLLNGWLREIRDIARIHKDKLTVISDPELQHRTLVELNVKEQCVNVLKTSSVQRSYIKTGYPMVHGWVYDLSEGLIKDLDIDHDALLEQVQEVYDLRTEI